jgi:cobalt-zinc-cadmium efflux system membrane fusion protein
LEQERGPKGGKLFRDGDFSIELTIFEKGVPPQFRVYSYENDKPVDPSKVNLSIELYRLDGEINRFTFKPENDVLVGDGVVAEPHSFDVKMNADYKGLSHRWEFESHEGRTVISEKAALEGGIKTEIAGPSTISEYVSLTGRIILNPNTTAQVHARFPGIVKSVNALWGEEVKKGDILARVESNKSLRSFNVVSPLDGIIMSRNTNVGDVVADEPLFTIADLSEVWAEFHVFPSDLPSINQGQMVQVSSLNIHQDKEQEITEAPLRMLLPTADANSQTVLAIVPLDNKEGVWRPGMTVKGNVLVNEKQVSLAVKTSALQRFRDFDVVFAKVGNTYEVRMLELGISDSEMVEVIDGLKPDTEYVTENSFLIKADVEKSGASHDH